MASLGLHCCLQAFSVFFARASHCSGFSCCGVTGPTGFSCCSAVLSVVVALLMGSRAPGSVVAAHGVNYCTPCGILPDQGSNPRALTRQAHSQPLDYQGSPRQIILSIRKLRLHISVQIMVLMYILGTCILLLMLSPIETEMEGEREGWVDTWWDVCMSGCGDRWMSR